MASPLRSTAVAVRELPGEREPLVLFERLRAGSCPWLLDSALRSSRLGAFSFAGADPWLVLRSRGGRVGIDCRRAVYGGPPVGDSERDGDLLEVARELLPRLAPGAVPGLPFLGGAVGYLGYELGCAIEGVPPAACDDLALPDAVLLFVDRLVAWDHEHDRAVAVALGFGRDTEAARGEAERGAADFEAWLAGPAAARRPRPARVARAPFAFFDESLYAKSVHRILEEVAAGNVYQANLTHRSECDFTGDPWALYRELRRINPAPFACFLELPEACVVGSSPERFLRVDAAGRVESRPIKGTRPRGRHASEDAGNRAALAASEKDRAENLMIVDLVRNDLGRACETGSVAVPELMAIEEYASVFQLVSTVTGHLRADRDVFDLLRASFPPGSMTGAPKIAAMRLLADLEPVRRGIYSGALGYLDARGGADLSVVIRTLVVRDGRAYLHSGGAVVADSDPRAEWRETLDKAAPLQAALGETAGGGPTAPETPTAE